MKSLLDEAIAELNLQPGESYRTSVNGHDVEVRMLPEDQQASASEEVTPEFANMVMLQPWFEIPDGPTQYSMQCTLGPGLPFDPPIIPDDFGDEE